MPTGKINLTKADAKAFIERQKSIYSDSNSTLENLNWNEARSIDTKNGNIWKLNLAGQPTFQNVKQGYRQLAIRRNLKSNEIEARILEIIPDAIYLQKEKYASQKTFTGRVFQYDLAYKLKGGQLFNGGKQIGEIGTKEQFEKQLVHGLKDLNPLKGIQGKVMMMQVMESCAWYQDSYVDGTGEFTVHSERICSYSAYDDGMNWGGGGNNTINQEVPAGGGGSGGSSGSEPSPPPPATSNLPGENNNQVDPKKMMECFSQIPSPNAAFVVRVYVVEPQPGTSFNVGQNSFGHVAISLSKTSGETTITQTVGFYPTGSGLDKLSSRSQIKDNGDLEYDVSSTYFVTAESFQKVINYVSNPPTNYDFIDFNCSAFVYGAGQAGAIPIPDPTTVIGLSGAGGAGFAKTPAGMASALREQKINNPNSDINEAGGRIPGSKGPCN
ncbi:hypothetical protein [Pedobacter mucosus]|uniref:hypothetical protein n=1 Tax=Pedobacter mucosus TaxID=2895286 RepID=UPI001EE3F4D7|nr:hypothetical protein [Pedobacter mucosus]UKT65061.1 hypothetical protein LOK61_04605 [Pedobacter mucosus]